MGSTGIQQAATPSFVSEVAYCSASRKGGGSSSRFSMAWREWSKAGTMGVVSASYE